MPITSFEPLYKRAYQPGDLIDQTPHEPWTFLNGIEDVLPFGLGVVADITGKSPTSATAKVFMPSAVDERFIGITYRTHTVEIIDGISRIAGTELIGYPKRSLITLIRKGNMAVWIDTEAKRGEKVFLRFAEQEGTTGIAGCFCNSPGANAIPLSNANFLRNTPAPTPGTMSVGYINLRGINLE